MAVNIDKLIENNRRFFSRQPVTLTDYKTVNLSTDNISLSEVIDLILWSTLSNKSLRDEKK